MSRWSAARELVEASHQVADNKFKGDLETSVRREVGIFRQRADELLLALSPQDSQRIGVVRCAFQWAQNSTAIFLSVKFSHRWSSPGALKLHDEQVQVSSCCFNFSANGEHSQLRKRYSLDLLFQHEVDADHWSWQPASAGRLTAEIRKKEPANWKKLLAGKDRPANMASWDSMQAKWASELKSFSASKKGEETKAKKKKPEQSVEAREANEEHEHEELSAKCYAGPGTPFYRDSRVADLCEAYWPPKMSGLLGKDIMWVVLFYDPQELKCGKRTKECDQLRDRWLAVQKQVQDHSKAKIGAVDCAAHAAFCKKQAVGHMPFVRRYQSGKRKAFYGDWDIDSVMRFVMG